MDHPAETSDLESILPGCAACRDTSGGLPGLRMAFQPIVNVPERRVTAYEALVRGPQGQPASWVFEQLQDGQLYTFDQACRVAAIRSAARLGMRVRLSINILPNAVYSARTCIQATLRALQETGFPAADLMFELTEHEQVMDPVHVRRIIDTYRDLGFATALDDYGAGHATAGLLLALRPDVIKLDLHVVRGLHESRWCRALIHSVAAFAADVGLIVIAEGVEDVQEARALLQVGVTHMQGYLFARPAIEALPDVPDHVFDACLDGPTSSVT